MQGPIRTIVELLIEREVTLAVDLKNRIEIDTLIFIIPLSYRADLSPPPLSRIRVNLTLVMMGGA